MTKRPVEAPLAVYRSHSVHLSTMNMELGVFDICVARDKLVFSLSERTGNIWMAEFK